MKGIETGQQLVLANGRGRRSDHCPAMKGIETQDVLGRAAWVAARSDHCPAMKGIETGGRRPDAPDADGEATTAPQ